jgi:hypothetical protein
MNAAGEPVLLRPLTLGEIFDRAVTVYVRDLPLFTLIALALAVPLSIMQYFATRNTADAYAQIFAQIQHPGKVPSATAGDAQAAWLLGLIGVALVLTPFATVAIAVAVGRFYRGESADWRSCYALALCELLTFAVVLLAGVFAMSVAFFTAFLLVRASGALGAVAGIAAAAVVIMWLASLMLCYLAFALAFNAIGIEGLGFGGAIARGFARVFNRAELLRAALVCLAVIAVYVGMALLSTMVGVIVNVVLHARIIDIIVQGIFSVVITSFIGVLLAVYYFDVRVRREGLDVQAEIEGLGPLASAP